MRLVVGLLAGLTLAMPGYAALDIGERAPEFTASAAQGGKVYQYSLADALKKGPVVLYFFPAAYSEGCSVEAHYFAEAIPDFQSLGATVEGIGCVHGAMVVAHAISRKARLRIRGAWDGLNRTHADLTKLTLADSARAA